MRQIPVDCKVIYATICFATGIHRIIFLTKNAVYFPVLSIFLLYLTGFVRKLFDMTRLYDFNVFIILDLSCSSFSENNERGRGISRNELIQYNCFTAKFSLICKNYANSRSMLFLTFENASYNRRTRPVNNSLRYHRQERWYFRHTFLAHSLPSFRNEPWSRTVNDFEECVCFVRVLKEKKKKKMRKGSHTHTHCGSCIFFLFTSRPGVQ